MAAKAAEEALADSGLKAEEIDLILVATSSSETVFPNTSCEVQKAIGAVHAWGYDLNAACSGFILALNTAQSYIRSGLVKTALVIGAEKMSRIVDWKDRGTCILFGDGAGAVVLRGEESESAEAVYAAMAHSAGDKGEALTLQYGTEETPVIRMDGQAVFKFAVRKVPEIIEEMLKKADVSREDVDYFVLHQANRRIIEAAAKRVGVEIEKFPMNLGEYANTSAASVPILLNESGWKAEKRSENYTCRIRGRTYMGRMPDGMVNSRKENKIMLEKVKEIVAESLNVEESTLSETTSFKEDLGADSLDLFEMVMAFEEAFEVEIPSEDLEQITTVGDVVKYIESHK